LQDSPDLMKELKELRQSLIKAAIKESGKAGRVVEQANKDRMDFIRKGSGGRIRNRGRASRCCRGIWEL
jgi:hypothetical protein